MDVGTGKLIEAVLIGGGVIGLALWSYLSTQRELKRDREARGRSEHEDPPPGPPSGPPPAP